MYLLKNASQAFLMFLCFVGIRQIDYSLFTEIGRVDRGELLYIVVVATVVQTAVSLFRSRRAFR